AQKQPKTEEDAENYNVLIYHRGHREHRGSIELVAEACGSIAPSHQSSCSPLHPLCPRWSNAVALLCVSAFLRRKEPAELFRAQRDHGSTHAGLRAARARRERKRAGNVRGESKGDAAHQ